VGQKVHPIGFRLGYIRESDAKWFADRSYREFTCEDMKIRGYLDRFNKKRPPTVARDLEERRVEEALRNASISRVEIGRGLNSVHLTITSAKPGFIIGKSGRGIEVLRILLARLTRRQVTVDVVEERQPDLDARLVAEKVASQLSRRVSFRRAVRQAIQSTMRANAQGVKIAVSGRLAGSEMARRHVHKEGKIPLQTLRADIDYGTCEAMTGYGNIGVKVWVYRGEKLPETEEPETIAMSVQPERVEPAADDAAGRGRRRGRRRGRGEGPETTEAAGVGGAASGAAELDAPPAVAEAAADDQE
jgi:small subunit ribosomal protein S3